MTTNKKILCAICTVWVSFFTGISLTAAEKSKFDQDREAILKLAGKFKVDFRFQETVAFKKGYELKKPYDAAAHELVKVVEDTGKTITLQHLLVVDSKKDNTQKVIKHWSQTWKYEDLDITGFVDKRHWETEQISVEEAKGTWSQMVSQIDDSPRYESYGLWQHGAGRSI